MARGDIPEWTIIDDFVTLLEQVHAPEPERDIAAVAAVAERYGVHFGAVDHG